MKNKYSNSQYILLLFSTFIMFISTCSKEKTSDCYGNFEAKEIMVSTEIQGKLLQESFEEGSALAKGEKVAIVDTSFLDIQREKINENIKALEAKVENVGRQIQVRKEKKKNLMIEKRRVQNLYQDSAMTEQQWDNITGKLRVVKAEIKAMQSKLEEVKHSKMSMLKQMEEIEEKITRCYVKNPIEGRVLEQYVREHEIVKTGAPLYKIADLSTMYLRAYVSGAQLSHVDIGQQVQVFFDKNENQNYSVPGTITWIADEAEFTPKKIQTKERRIDLVYAIKVKVKNNKGRIKIGMPGEVEFKE